MTASIPPDGSGASRAPGRGPDGRLPAAVTIPVWRPGSGQGRDRVVTEEPLEIRVDGRPLVVTLRTPGDDRELAVGLLVSEGVIEGPESIVTVVRIEDGPLAARGNVVDVRLADGTAVSGTTVDRPSLVNSACGVCGKTALDAVRRRAPVLGDGPRVKAVVLGRLPAALRRAQRVFEETGGLHAAGLFTAHGRLITACEDVGRHNAVDKVIGRAIQGEGVALSETLLAVSGRLGFEIAQKAWMVGIPVVASISAPSHLAVQLAEEAGMTLVGFLRNGAMNVYAGRERILERE